MQFGGETGERVAFGDDGNRSPRRPSAGKTLGGQVMHLVDMAAALAAHRHSNCYVVTASVELQSIFRNAVNLGGDRNVELAGQSCVFHTSMEVGVEVHSENVLTGERKHTTTAYVTFCGD